MNYSLYIPYLIFAGAILGTSYITREYFSALAKELEFNDVGIVTGGFCLFAVVLASGSTIIGFIRFLIICVSAGFTTFVLYSRENSPGDDPGKERLLDGRDDYDRLNLILIVGFSLAVIIFPKDSFVPQLSVIGPTLFILVIASMASVAISLALFSSGEN